ncbi:hypothetical protein RUND412_006095, partial [Rhizina undulata]
MPAKQSKVTLTTPAITPEKQTYKMQALLSSISTSGNPSGVSRKYLRIEEQLADYLLDDD